MKSIPAFRNVLASACCLFAAAALMSVPAKAEVEIMRINGASPMDSACIQPYLKRLQDAAGVKIVTIGNGSASGLKDLVQKTCHMAMISDELPSVIKTVNAKEPNTIKEPNNLKAHRAGQMELVLVAHSSLSGVKSLTQGQLAQLLAGEITNWKTLGAGFPDLPVKMVVVTTNSGVRMALENLVMKPAGKKVADSVKAVSTAKMVVTAVAGAPGTAGITSMEIAQGGMSSYNLARIALEPGIIQPLYFVTDGEPTEKQKLVIDEVIKAVGETGK